MASLTTGKAGKLARQDDVLGETADPIVGPLYLGDFGDIGKSAPVSRTAAPAPASPAVKTAVVPHPLCCGGFPPPATAALYADASFSKLVTQRPRSRSKPSFTA